MLRKPGRCFLFTVTAWLALATLPAHAQQPPPAPLTVIDGLGKGSVELTGPWQFHTGDDPAWASAAFDDSNWEQIRADSSWSAQGHEGYTGFAWYRLHFQFHPAKDAEPEFALIVNSVIDAYELYLNGVLIGHNGKLPPNPSWYLPTQWSQTYGLGPVRSGVIAFRVWKAPPGRSDMEEGGFQVPPIVGSPDAIGNLKATLDYQWLRGEINPLIEIFLYAFAAVLGLIGWIRDRRQSYLFWMTVLALFAGIALALWSLPLTLSYNTISGLVWLFDSIQTVAAYFLLLSILDLEKSRNLVRVVRVASLIQLAVLLHTELSYQSSIFSAGVAASSWVYVFLGALPAFLLLCAALKRRKVDHARWLVAVLLCVEWLLAILGFLFATTSRYTHWTQLQSILESPLFAFNGSAVSLGSLARVAVLLSFIYAIYRNSQHNRDRQAALEQEFRSARELQQVLIPETLPTVPGFALTSAYRPAQEVGGDFFQITPLGEDATLIVLGDVSGKGLRAAMTVSLIVGMIHALAEESASPARLLDQLNRRLIGRLQGGFVTCIAMRVTSAGTCIMASAGHPGPFFNSQELQLPGSLPLGLTAAADYEESTVRLRVGDRLSLFTDGLLEATGASGELFGFARLANLFANKPTATEASEAAVAFGQDDDITVLTLTRLMAGAESTAVYSTLKTLARTLSEQAPSTRP